MRTIAVYHNKGGVGKTTTVVNLAAGLSRAGYRVLVVDLDAQANATLALGVSGRNREEVEAIRERHVVHLLTNKLLRVSQVTRPSNFGKSKVDVVPSHISVHDMEKQLAATAKGAKLRLQRKLEQESDRWDVVLIDAPPARNVFAEIALLACDCLLIPSDLKTFAFSGLDTVLRFVDEMDAVRAQQPDRQPVRLLGVLPSKVLPNAAFLKHTLPDLMSRVHRHFGVDVLETYISERIDVAKAFDGELGDSGEFIPRPKSIFDYKPGSPATKEFQALTKEIVKRAGIRR